jgi:hypothetical protein
MQVETEGIGGEMKEWKRKKEIGREAEGMINETEVMRWEIERMMGETE